MPWTDPRTEGLLPDVYVAMGQTAENVASHTGISREDQDRWGVRSHNRAEEAIKSGFFEREITPVTSPTARSSAPTTVRVRAPTTRPSVSSSRSSARTAR